MKYHIARLDTIGYTLCGIWMLQNLGSYRKSKGLCKKCARVMEKQESILAHKGDSE